MTDKQIIGGRGSAKSYTTLNTIEVMLENEKLEEALKVKEQECEELKTKLLNWLGKEGLRQSDKEFYEEQLDQLKAENEVLKQYKASKQASYESMQRQWNEAINKNRKLKQILTEIKEFAENFCSESCPYKDDEYDICVEDCFLDEIVNPILQKISEVEDV